MSKKVVVTRAQKAAARAMVERSAVTGRHVSGSVRKIADAKVQPVTAKMDSAASTARPRETA